MTKNLNDPSFFRKGGLLVENGRGRVHQEVGRNPLDGTWYVELKRDDGLMIRSVMTPDQAFAMFKGGLIAMARFTPARIGEIRSLLTALTPHG